LKFWNWEIAKLNFPIAEYLFAARQGIAGVQDKPSLLVVQATTAVEECDATIAQ